MMVECRQDVYDHPICPFFSAQWFCSDQQGDPFDKLRYRYFLSSSNLHVWGVDEREVYRLNLWKFNAEGQVVDECVDDEDIEITYYHKS